MNEVAPRAERVAYDAVRVAQALANCKQYLFTIGSNGFSGRAFCVGFTKTPNVISVADLESLKTLSVARNINAPHQAEAFARRPRVATLLSLIADTPIRDMPDYVHHSAQHAKDDEGCCTWGPVDRLWYEVAHVNQFGHYVVRSKLLARKRPALIPIYDDYVGRALGIGTMTRLDYSLWGTMQAVVQSERVWSKLTAIHDALSTSHSENPNLEGVTPLRALDIILWMKYRNRGASR